MTRDEAVKLLVDKNLWKHTFEYGLLDALVALGVLRLDEHEEADAPILKRQCPECEGAGVVDDWVAKLD